MEVPDVTTSCQSITQSGSPVTVQLKEKIKIMLGCVQSGRGKQRYKMAAARPGFAQTSKEVLGLLRS